MVLPKLFLKIADELSLVDVWRTRNPGTGFFSHRYNSWSRIEACWASTNMMYNMEEVDILPSTFADHNPLMIKLRTTHKRFNWRLNVSHLNHEKFVKDVKEEMIFIPAKFKLGSL